MDAAPEGADGAAESALELAAPAQTGCNQEAWVAMCCVTCPQYGGRVMPLKRACSQTVLLMDRLASM